jgi:hypothetical protein
MRTGSAAIFPGATLDEDAWEDLLSGAAEPGTAADRRQLVEPRALRRRSQR